MQIAVARETSLACRTIHLRQNPAVRFTFQVISLSPLSQFTLLAPPQDAQAKSHAGAPSACPRSLHSLRHPASCQLHSHRCVSSSARCRRCSLSITCSALHRFPSPPRLVLLGASTWHITGCHAGTATSMITATSMAGDEGDDRHVAACARRLLREMVRHAPNLPCH